MVASVTLRDAERIRGGYNAGIKNLKQIRTMIKKEYQKPTMRIVQLQYRHQILVGSYAGIQSSNSVDDDDPIYDSSSGGSIWDAN